MHILLTRQLEDCTNLMTRFVGLGHVVSHLPLLNIEKVLYDQKIINNCEAISTANLFNFIGKVFASSPEVLWIKMLFQYP